MVGFFTKVSFYMIKSSKVFWHLRYFEEETFLIGISNSLFIWEFNLPHILLLLLTDEMLKNGLVRSWLSRYLKNCRKAGVSFLDSSYLLSFVELPPIFSNIIFGSFANIETFAVTGLAKLLSSEMVSSLLSDFPNEKPALCMA